ncbi:MAG: FAD-dependent oxidoreductase, partial [Acidimicrobiales bacterium]
MASEAQLDVVVVGAGLAGLTAAAALARAGRRVQVLDAGDQVGGRLATRRVGDALIDHGAQFFTARSPVMAAFVEGLCGEGVAYEWCRGFNEVDGYPRYAVRGGMAALAQHLAAGLEVTLAAPVAAVAAAGGGGRGWRVELAGGQRHVEAAAVVLTAPVPEALALVRAGGAPLDPALAA